MLVNFLTKYNRFGAYLIPQYFSYILMKSQSQVELNNDNRYKSD